MDKLKIDKNYAIVDVPLQSLYTGGWWSGHCAEPVCAGCGQWSGGSDQ